LDSSITWLTPGRCYKQPSYLEALSQKERARPPRGGGNYPNFGSSPILVWLIRQGFLLADRKSDAIYFYTPPLTPHVEWATVICLDFENGKSWAELIVL